MLIIQAILWRMLYSAKLRHCNAACAMPQRRMDADLRHYVKLLRRSRYGEATFEPFFNIVTASKDDILPNAGILFSAAKGRFVRTLSVQEERSEYPVLPVCKKASAFEADYEAISRTNGQNKSYACSWPP
jgi:hypothetical protein